MPSTARPGATPRPSCRRTAAASVTSFRSRLFPHLTVLQNLRYGERLLPRSERREISRIATLLGITDLLARRPSHLSGGESSAWPSASLDGKPEAALMDEPLSALDAALKAQILPYIERIRDEFGVPILYVSHSVEEVARLANAVVTFDHGKARAVGRPDEALATVARASGDLPAGNFIEARSWPTTSHGLTKCPLLRADPAADLAANRHPASAFSCPSPISFFATQPAEACPRSIACPVKSSNREGTGASATVTVDCQGQTLSPKSPGGRCASWRCPRQTGAVPLLFKTVSIASEGLFRQARG